MKTAKKTDTSAGLPTGAVLLAKPQDPTKDFKCVRCQWEWEWRKSRTEGRLPARCPHCSSTAWNKAKREPK